MRYISEIIFVLVTATAAVTGEKVDTSVLKSCEHSEVSFNRRRQLSARPKIHISNSTVAKKICLFWYMFFYVYRIVIRGRYAQLARHQFYGDFWAPTRQKAGALMSATVDFVLMMMATFLAPATRRKKTTRNANYCST